jgi:uncharacterized protein YbjT (DUF2867 family)
VARVLIVGCGCRGEALARELIASGHPVRGTTRNAERATQLEAAGIEAVVADPYRLATLLPHVANTSVMCWLMGSATGDDVEALHTTRLQTVMERLVDTPVRGMVYEAAGTIDRQLLLGGAAIVRAAAATWEMPEAIVEADPADGEAWRKAMVAGVERVLAV